MNNAPSTPGAPDFRGIVRRRLRRRSDADLPGAQRRFEELVDEIAGHLEDQYVDALAAGMSRNEAEKIVLHDADADWESLAHAAAEPLPDAPFTATEHLMETLTQDLRFAARSLRARPLFAAAVVLLLALGIGANTALFTVVHSILLAPLPYREPHELVSISEGDRREEGPSGRSNMKAANLRDLRTRARTLEDIAAYWQGPAVYTGGEEPEMLAVIRATHNVLSVLGVDPAAGAGFAASHEQAALTAVLDHDYWQRRFAGDPQAVGTAMTLAGEPYRIVGVTPPDFRFLDEPFDAIIVGSRPAPEPPIDLGEAYENDRSLGYLRSVARLADGATAVDAATELRAVGEALAQEFPGDQSGRTFWARPLRELLVESVRTPLLLLFAAVGFVLLIACANVANLLLARARTRGREMAIRRALGASRGRVVRQLLTESVVLATLGGAGGIGLALLVMGPLRAFLPDTLPRNAEIAVDANGLAFTLVLSLLTGIAFGLAPAWQSIAPRGQAAMQGMRATGHSAPGGRSRALLGDALVVVEIALAVVLLTGAGLTLRSLMALQARDPGFDPEHVLTLRLSLPQTKYDSDEAIAALYARVHEELNALPGVESAATVLGLPFSGTRAGLEYGIWGEDVSAPGGLHVANFQPVSPDYFRTVGIPILAGRDFQPSDRGQPVAIINEEVVRRHFADVDPLSQALILDEGPDPTPVPIVGVVGATRYGGYASDALPEIYVGFDQLALSLTAVVVRALGDPEALIAPVRSKILEIDPDQPVYRVQTLSDLMSETLEQPRFHSRLLTLFAAIAMLLAAAGVFGVISYSVSQRTREFGIRMALGADTGRVLRLVVRRGASLSLIGVISGSVFAALVARLIGSLWVGITMDDPAVFVAVPLLLMAVALLATWAPARRATRVDPIVALRAES